MIPEEIEVKKWARDNGHDASDYEAFIQTELFKNEIDSRIKAVAKEKQFNGLELP